MLTNDLRRELGERARAYDLPESHVLAVAHVESAGKVFARVGTRDEPLIRFEGHIFDRRLSGKAQVTARERGLSSPRAGAVRNPPGQEGRWRLLHAAMTVDAQGALESTSWGVGQVMGMHWRMLGFESVEAFVATARSGFGGQVDLMLRFIRMSGCEDDLRAGRLASFARRYNGPNYRVNRYDTKLKAAIALYGGHDEPANGMLRMGAKGERVRELQALLVRAGYAVRVDGDFGPSTRTALQGFQGARGLAADGVYGPKTEGALAQYRQAEGETPGRQKVLDISAVKRGGVVATASAIVADINPDVLAKAKTGLEQAAAEIAGASVKLAVLDYLSTGLTVAASIVGVVALGYAVAGVVRSRQTFVP